MRMLKLILVIIFQIFISVKIFSLEVGKPAPLFSLKNQDGKIISLANNKAKVWTVVYFFPKAETPGCTTEANAFRDSISLIEKQKAVVYGVSTDGVFALKEFQKNHQLNFDLLSDEDAKISEAYETKMPLLTMSKRVTFIIDDKLNVRSIDYNVDPATNAKKVAEEIQKLRRENFPI